MGFHKPVSANGMQNVEGGNRKADGQCTRQRSTKNGLQFYGELDFTLISRPTSMFILQVFQRAKIVCRCLISSNFDQQRITNRTKINCIKILLPYPPLFHLLIESAEEPRTFRNRSMMELKYHKEDLI